MCPIEGLSSSSNELKALNGCCNVELAFTCNETSGQDLFPSFLSDAETNALQSAMFAFCVSLLLIYLDSR